MKNVPNATLQRYPVYLKALRKIASSGKQRIMSRELSEYVNIKPTTIRRDFSFSGLKNASIQLVKRLERNGEELNKADLAYAFQETALKQLLNKITTPHGYSRR